MVRVYGPLVGHALERTFDRVNRNVAAVTKVKDLRAVAERKL
jgi:hypothetical protein